jgi:hypothetical protein
VWSRCGLETVVSGDNTPLRLDPTATVHDHPRGGRDVRRVRGTRGYT